MTLPSAALHLFSHALSCSDGCAVSITTKRPLLSCSLHAVKISRIWNFQRHCAVSYLSLPTGIRNGSITIDETVRMQLIDWFVSQPAFIRAIFPEFIWNIDAYDGECVHLVSCIWSSIVYFLM